MIIWKRFRLNYQYSLEKACELSMHFQSSIMCFEHFQMLIILDYCFLYFCEMACETIHTVYMLYVNYQFFMLITAAS